NTLEGSPIVELYNYLRVDATAIGNHEFDFGPQGPDRVQVQSTQDPLGALRLRMKEAHFPFLSVNIIDRLTGRPLPDIAPSKVIEKEGVTIGIIGATTQHTPESTIAANVAHLKFVDPIPLIKSEALRLKKEGVDFIVITYHEGEKCKDHSLESLDDVKTCSTESILPLIDQMPKGLIDVIVAGHTHRDLIKRYKGVVILQSGARGQYLTWAELSKNDSTPVASSQVSKTEICELAQEDKNGEFVCQSWSVRKNDRPFTARTFKGVVIVPDEWVETHIVHPNVSRVVALKSRKTKVVVDGNMDRRYSGESPLGNWFTSSMQAAAAHAGYDTDAAVINNGGLRANISDTTVTYGDIFSVLPFDDTLAVLELTGNQVRKMIEMQLSNSEGYSLSGITFHANHQCQISDVQINGKPLDPEATYKVLTLDFLASGGSGFKSLEVKKEKIHFLYELGFLRDLLFQNFKQEDQVVTPYSYFNASIQRQNAPTVCLQR
ncbi:MAG: bifunctional metallophosphatase/5'-nucleotidase, partial [Bdellovibrionales bacterium]|nr:bifunctional metallophosphatase/5'-nucleotidase [Bdellovibrionales bacterium]